MKTMKSMLFFLLAALNVLAVDDLPDFKVNDILVLQDGFIALKIENSSPGDFRLPSAARDRVFISLAINGVKRAEYKFKAVDPTVFLRNSFIVFKTNFRAGQPQRLRVEVNGERVVPESDFANNILEKDLRPQT
jgi:hypothetical protein